jgi:hypothetical protein
MQSNVCKPNEKKTPHARLPWLSRGRHEKSQTSNAQHARPDQDARYGPQPYIYRPPPCQPSFRGLPAVPLQP